MTQVQSAGSAQFSQYAAQRAVESVDVLVRPEVLNEGWWAVVGTSAGSVRAWRFEHVEPLLGEGAVSSSVSGADSWRGPTSDAWESSLDAKAYCAAVEEIKAQILSGQLQQCNLTRVLSAPLAGSDGGLEPQARGLYERIIQNHEAPYPGYIHVPAGGEVEPVWLVSASPELFLRRDESHLRATPIKGTARIAQELESKDEAESLLISAEVAAEFSHFCAPGTVEISAPHLEEHPGLVQLVREVRGELDPDLAGAPWERIFSKLCPPASVAGFPRDVAQSTIERLESAERGPYTGIFGWIDGDRKTAELAVTIRSFWWQDQRLHFGTGAGITAGSQAQVEWEETELKAAQLLALASQEVSQR